MHISTYLEVSSPDTEILARITEREVMLWLAARLDKLRAESKLPIYHMEVAVWQRANRPYDVAWNMHAPDICALTHETIESALLEVREKLLGDPRGRAQEKRRQAKELMAEAEQLETVALAEAV
jgi:predicted N-formylglutamate amidohydrolase